MKCLRERDFVWHHDIKVLTRTWVFNYKLWLCLSLDCKTSSPSPQHAIPLLPGPPFMHPSLLTTCLLQLFHGWDATLLPGDLATSQGLFYFLTGAEPLPLSKEEIHPCTSVSVTHTGSLKGGSWRYSVCNVLCYTQHTGSLTIGWIQELKEWYSLQCTGHCHKSILL